MDINKYIFREYDVRGKVEDDFPPEVVEALGKAFGHDSGDIFFLVWYFDYFGNILMIYKKVYLMNCLILFYEGFCHQFFMMSSINLLLLSMNFKT